MSTVTVNSTAQLLSALASAQSGETIQVSAGNYASVNINNIHVAGNVTVTSASATNQAVFNGLDVSNSSGLTFSNIAVDGSKTTDVYAVRLGGSQNIVFNDVNFHGSLDGNPADDNQGLLVEGNQNVTITNSQFQQFSNAVADLYNTGVTISNNSFHDIESDGIDNGGSSNVTISNNSFTNFYPGTSSQHPDAIQFWTTNTTASASNITISGNTITAGSGGQIQGIFISDQSGGLLPYQNVTVTGNTVIGEEWNGIAVGNAHNVTVANNTVQGNSNATGAGNAIGTGAGATSSWIEVVGSSNVNLSGNSSNSYVLTGDTNLTQGAVNYLNGVAQTATMTSSVSTTLSLLSNTLVLTGTAAITGNANATGSTIYANNAGDRLNDGLGNDTLIGGTGNDVLVSNSGSDTLTGGGGNDTFQIGAGIGHDVITDFGAGGGDTLNLAAFMAAGHTPILTNVGSDLVISFSGSSATVTLKGVQANQLLATSTGYVSTFAAPVYSSTSTTLDPYHHTLILQGTSAISGAANAVGSTIYANNAGDRLFDGAGNDTLIGGTGNDTLISAAGNDTLTGGGGSNTFQIGAGIGHDVITDFGASGGDTLNLSAFMAAGHAPILTNVGSNLVISFAGTSATLTLQGVQANQLLATSTGYISALAAPIYASASTTLDTFHHTMILQGTGAISGAANAVGSTIYANNAGDRLMDGSGNDTLIGGAGNDILVSTAGSDTLTGGAGNDTFQIGTGIGHDVITDFGAGGGDTLVLSSFMAAGHTPILTNVGSDLVISFTGSSATVTLKGVQANQLAATSTGYISSFAAPVYASTTTKLDAFHHTLVLEGTTSLLHGTANATGSTIYANNFGDVLYDGAGNDTLIGGTGNDTFESSAGNDTLTGGGGRDNFMINTGIGHDVITDFSNGDMLTISSFLNAGMKPILTNVGANTVISFTGGPETITLLGVHASDLHAASYGFTH